MTLLSLIHIWQSRALKAEAELYIESSGIGHAIDVAFARSFASDAGWRTRKAREKEQKAQTTAALRMAA